MPEGSTAQPWWKPLLRPAVVFFGVFVLLLVFAGPKRFGPSPAPHYAYVAQGWLHGRLGLEGDPPGYPRAHDDWAKVVTLELTDGTRFRGYPCVTQHCRQLRTEERRTRRTRVEVWWDLADRSSPRVVQSNEIAKREVAWYVSFPPGPALFMLPLVAVFGLAAPEILLVAFAAALIPAIVLWWLDDRRGRDGPEGLGNLAAALALGLASPAVVLGAHGRVWFTAQVLGALFCTLYVIGSDRARRPWLAGIGLALAISCRPHLLLATPLFVIAWWRDGKDPKKALAFCLPLAVVGLALAAHNHARFGSIFEFGHRFLDIRWQTRMQEHGQFSVIYLRRNLECLLWLMPRPQATFPFAKVSIHGMAAWLASPWLFAAGALALPRREAEGDVPVEPIWPLALVLASVAAVPLFYHNSGQLQFSYRFALDWLPFAVAAFATRGLFDRRWVQVLVLAGISINLHGAWWFDRAPTDLFVVEPLGWPFERELGPSPRR